MIRTLCLSLLSLFLFTQELVCQPIVPCGINRSDKRKAPVAATMIFYNEGRYIKEWLEYHKSIGITHFYLYNNASTDDFWAILMPYVTSGEVELFDVFKISPDGETHFNLQRQVYAHAVSLANGKNTWLAIIDSDEFICMPHHNDLRKFLKDYLYATSLVIYWAMYGSSNIEELGPNDLQIERFVYRTPDNWPENFLFKTIVRPEYVVKADIHVSECNPDMLVTSNHQRFSHTPTFSAPPLDEIRINHYWWRDEKYFREVKRPRRLGWLFNLNDAQVEERRQIYNSVYDPAMAPFVEQTRNGMSSKPKKKR